MIGSQSVIAIIPARSGSKRLEGKNLKPLLGKPLIEWTISASKKSKYIDKTLVSSDSQEIISISQKKGVCTQLRPKQFSDDEATTFSVVQYVLDKLDEKFEYVILLQPTSPLRTSENIDEAFELLNEKSADAVVSVSELEHPLEWCNLIPPDLSLENFIDEKYKNCRSQDFKKYYRLNGSIFITNIFEIFRYVLFFPFCT